MLLKAYTGFSDFDLIGHPNGNIHYQLFCGVQINPTHPLTNYKIVNAIRQELSERLDIELVQQVLATHWKPYLENLHVCMPGATCYESYMRFPTDVKLLWESVEWLHRSYRKKLSLSPDYQKRLSVIRKVLKGFVCRKENSGPYSQPRPSLRPSYCSWQRE